MAHKKKELSGDGLALYNAVHGKMELQDFANAIGRSLTMVHNYCNSDVLTAHIKAMCAKAIGMDVSELFGTNSAIYKVKQEKNTDVSWTGIGYRLKRARMGLGYTNTEFCIDLGSWKDKSKPFSRASLSRIESGEDRLPDWVLFELVNRYNINEAWLLTGRGTSGIVI